MKVARATQARMHATRRRGPVRVMSGRKALVVVCTGSVKIKNKVLVH